MAIRRWFEDYVFEVSDFLPADRCDELIAQAERQQFEEATVNTAGGHLRRENLRNNDRVICDDGKLSAELWASAATLVPRTFKGRIASGLNERLRFYRYDPGQKFDWHQDGYYERENGERSQFTFMVYLNDGFGGGGTSFVDPHGRLFDPFTVVPEKGSALFFYHHLDHRGDEVTSGRKYVLRSDVMYALPGGTN